MYKHKNGLSLVKMEEYHLPGMMRWKSESWTTQHQSVILNERDQDRFFARMSDSPRDYYMIAKKDDVVIGSVNITGIDWVSRCAEVGMMACPKMRGTSVVSNLPEIITDFGFEFMNLNRLQAEVLDNNPAALKFDLGLGYQVEGRRRQAVYKSGSYHDSILIAMLRQDWSSSDRVKSYGGVCNTQCKDRKSFDKVLAKYSKEGLELG